MNTHLRNTIMVHKYSLWKDLILQFIIRVDVKFNLPLSCLLGSLVLQGAEQTSHQHWQ